MPDYKYLYFQLLNGLTETISSLDEIIDSLDTAAYNLDNTKDDLKRMQQKSRMLCVERVLSSSEENNDL